MKRTNLSEKVFNFYAAPIRLLDVFIERTTKDTQAMQSGTPSLMEQFGSPHFQSYARNAQCTAIVAFVTFGAVATSVASPLLAIAAYSAVSYASTRALKVEEKYQAKQRMERKLTAL